jgi:hypothetical protein
VSEPPGLATAVSEGVVEGLNAPAGNINVGGVCAESVWSPNPNNSLAGDAMGTLYVRNYQHRYPRMLWDWFW